MCESSSSILDSELILSEPQFPHLLLVRIRLHNHEAQSSHQDPHKQFIALKGREVLDSESEAHALSFLAGGMS